MYQILTYTRLWTIYSRDPLKGENNNKEILSQRMWQSIVLRKDKQTPQWIPYHRTEKKHMTQKSLK